MEDTRKASIWFNGKLAGLLVMSSDEEYQFRYVASYLNNLDNIPIDPIHLPMEEAPFYSKELFGVMRDALPDSWGRFVLAKDLNLDASRISDFDCIQNISSDGVGCIEFGSVTESNIVKPNRGNSITLRDLQRNIGDMNYECSQAIARLLHAGSSMGGARPKASVIHNGVHYLAKFNQKDDTLNVCLCEYAAMTFAKTMGINVSDISITQIQEHDVLLVKRFDRENGKKYPFLSALTLSGRNERDFMHSSYVELDALSRTLTKQSDGEQWLRRMTYNVLCNNDDDHLRNHGFIAKDNQWTLSPAYDIMPHAMRGETYRLAIGLTHNNRTASLDNAIEAGRIMGIDNAELIVCDMQKKFKNWQTHFERCGVSEHDIQMFDHIFNRFSSSLDMG